MKMIGPLWIRMIPAQAKCTGRKFPAVVWVWIVTIRLFLRAC